MSATFPLALGFSVTRRDFYLGTALTYLLLSALLRRDLHGARAR